MATKAVEQPQLLTFVQAAAMLGVSRMTMRRIIWAGAIEPVLIPGLGRPRYRRSDLEAIVAGRVGRAP
jgi:predicted site-specific integrase-resolvase